MGGRLDATNVLDVGVAAITNVQHDHERYLGRTLAAIGTEKAAIIKPGNLAVTGATGRGLRPIAERAPAAGGAALRWPGRGGRTAPPLREAGWDGLLIDLRSPDGVLRDVHVGLLGSHQAGNAAVALALLDALRADAARRGMPLDGITEATLRAGLRDVQLARAAGAAARHALRRRPAGWCAQPGRRPRARQRAATSWACARFPLVFGAMRGKRVPRHAARPGRAGPDPGLHRGGRSGRALATTSCCDAWHARSAASAAAPPPIPGRRWRGQPGCAALRTSRSWWPARSTWSARCVACSPARRTA